MNTDFDYLSRLGEAALRRSLTNKTGEGRLGAAQRAWAYFRDADNQVMVTAAENRIRVVRRINEAMRLGDAALRRSLKNKTHKGRLDAARAAWDYYAVAVRAAAWEHDDPALARAKWGQDRADRRTESIRYAMGR